MADKRIEFDLVFKSNIDQAKKQMKDLKKLLNDIATGKNLDLSKGMTQEIKEASKAASELQTHLLKATNVNTGRLNMNEFERSIKASGGSLKQYAAQLAQLGPTGRTALMQVSQAIANAEKPTLRLSGAIDKMWVAMKNTMRWQLSTTALNAVTGAISGAYQYAQKLNRSLNDIRIVTGRSTDEMAEFAKQANRAAQALSATTTEYTKASLIYYQQGLSDEEVAKRTETTIKLANVTRTSAETVSEWMTSIWNNFDNGSKSLEYYADVITALGAATASSSEEIATGLEKFSAVAESVGLSYEYATSALATITATTRQSADVVGTALKTLFARMQDLELGKTLDDGTTMGQYSDNLAKIGVNVLDVSGQLREMDAVLNDLGARWNNLTEAQKVATAQGVAGIRQYTQFMALMENWDFMQQNLATASGASGALDTQADIYAESWEAAQKRVTASAEQLYDSLLNDEVFIRMTNMLADFLDGLDPVLKSLGGLPGILSLVLSAVIKIKGQDIAGGLTRMGNALFDVTDKGQQAAERLRQSRLQTIRNAIYDVSDPTHPDNGTPEEADANNRRLKMIEIAQNYGANWDAETQSQFQDAVKLQEVLEEQLNIQRKKVVAAQEEVKEQEKLIEEIKELEKMQSDDQKILKKGEPVSKKNRKLTQKQREQKEAYDAAKGREDRRKTLGEEPLKQAEQKLKEKQELLDQETQMENERLQQNEQFITEQEENFNRQANSTKNWATAVVGAAQAVTSITATMSMAISTFNSLDDPNISGWQKLTMVLTSVSMILPLLANGYRAVTKSVKDGSLAQTLNIIVTALGIPVKKAAAEATDDLGDEAKETAQEVKKEAAAHVENTVAITAENAIKKTSGKGGGLSGVAGKVGGNLKNTGKAIGTGAKKVGSAVGKGFGKLFSTGGATAGASGGAAAGGGIGASLAALGPWIAVIAVAVAMVTTSVIRFKKHQEEYSLAAKRYAEEAERQKQALADVRQEYDNLKSSLEGINSSQDSIDKMVKGTLEWRQAVADTNNEISSLITKYPELAQYVQNVDGRMIISEEGQNALLEAQLAEVEKASGEVSFAQLQSNRANARLKADKIAQEEIKVSDLGGIAAGAATGALTGAAVAGPWGALGGAIIGGAAGFWGANELEMKREGDMREAIMELSRNYDPTSQLSFDEQIEALDINDEAVIQALKENEDSIQELIQSNRELIAANEAAEANLIASMVKGNYTEGEKALIGRIGAKNVEDKDIEVVREASKSEYKVNDAKANLAKAEEWMAQKYGEDWRDTYKLTGKDGKNFKIVNKETGEKVKTSYYDVFADLAEKELYAEQASEETAVSITTRRNQNINTVENVLKSSGISLDDTAVAQIADDITAGDVETTDLLNKLNREEVKVLEQKLGTMDQSSQAYKVLKKSVDEYDEALQRNNLLQSLSQGAVQDTTEEIKELLDEVKMEEAEFNDYADTLARTLGLEEDVAKGVALIYARANAGAEQLGKSLKSNLATLQTSNKTTLAYSKALSDTAKAVSNLFDVDVNGEFIEQHQELLQKIAQGDAEALIQLRNAVSTQLLNDNKNLSNEQRETILKATNAFTGSDSMIGQSASSNSAARELVNVLNQQIKSGILTYEQAADQLKAEGFAVGEGSTYNYTLSADELKAFAGDRPEGSAVELFDASQVVFASDTADMMETISEALEEQIDRYHYINELLEDQGRIIENNKQLLERAWGNQKKGAWEAYEKAVRDEAEFLKQRIEGADKVTGAAEWLETDTQALIKELENAGVSISEIVYDDKGRIANFEYLERTYGQDEESALWKKLTQYEDSLNEWEDLTQQYIEAQFKVEDLYLEELNTLLEEDLRVNEYWLGRLDFFEKALGDSKFTSLERVTNATDKFANYAEEFSDYEKRVNELLNKGTLTAQEQERLVQLQNEMQNTYLEMVSAYENGLKAFTDEAATWNDEIDKTEDKLERLTALADHYDNVLDIVGTDRLGLSAGIREDLAAARTQVALSQVGGSRAELEANEKLLEEAKASREELIASGADYTVIQYWDETIETLEKQVNDSQDALQDNLVGALQAAADEFAAAMEVVLEEFDTALGGIYGSIEELTEAFERQQELSELYFADYKKVYEINKLNRKITDSIDTTTNIKAQQALRDLQSELLVFQESGVEMSKYDLEYKQKEYDLLVAQIALEEAQNAKNQVRLTRDASGNWGYVYTANAAETEKAQQEYEDRLYDLQEYANESEQELVKGYLQTIADYKDQMAALSEEYDINSEEYRVRAQELQEEFNTKIQFYLQESEDLIGNNALANSRYMANLASTYQTSIWQTIYPAWEGFEEVGTNALNAVNTATDTAIGKHEEMGKKFDDICEAAGTDWSDLAKGITTAVGTDTTEGSIAKAAKDASEAIGKMATNMNNALTGEGGSLSIFQNWAEASIEQINNVRQALGLAKWEILKPTVDPEDTTKNELPADKPGDGTGGAGFTVDDNAGNTNQGGGTGVKIETGAIPGTDNRKIAQQLDAYKWVYAPESIHAPMEEALRPYLAAGAADATVERVLQYAADKKKNAFKTFLEEQGGMATKSDIVQWQQDYAASGQEDQAVSEAIEQEKLTRHKIQVNWETTRVNDAGTWISVTDTSSGKEYWLNKSTITRDLNASNFHFISEDSYYAPIGYDFEKDSAIWTTNQEDKYVTNFGQVEDILAYWSSQDQTWKPGVKLLMEDGTYRVYPLWCFTNDYALINKYDTTGLLKKKYIDEWMPNSFTQNYQGFQDAYGKVFPRVGDTAKTKDKVQGFSIAYDDFGNSLLKIDNGKVQTGLPRMWNKTTANGPVEQILVNTDGDYVYKIGSYYYDNDDIELVSRYDTGGYTGEWGSSGKMAMLHEKEIVLNKYDTANLLSAIDLVRQFESSLSSMSWGLGALRAISTNSLSNNLEQTVTIHAEFPNATDHNEIEQAFDNLVNLASQYAQKK